MTIREIVAPDTGVAFAAMSELRPHLGGADEFVRLVDNVLRPEGYRLVGAFEDTTDQVVAVAGFSVGHSVAWGHHLYVADLSTLPVARRRGHGQRLLEWLIEEGQRLGCDELHLDSGVGADRIDAHRLYFNAGMQISSHHFVRSLRPGR